MIAEWLEAWFEERYQRAPAHYLSTIRAFTVLLLAGVVVAVVPVFLAYIEATRAETVRSYLVAAGLAFVGGRFVLIPRWREVHRDVDRWLAGDRTPEQTLRAWEASKTLTLAGVRDALVVGVPTLWIPALVYAILEYDLSALGGLAALIGVTLIAALCIVFGWPVVDAYLRPVRRDLARHVPDARAQAHVRLPVALQLTAFVSVVGLLTGATVTVAATIGNRSVEEMGALLVLTTAVGLGGGLLFSSLLGRSLLTTMEDLVSVTEQVADGNIAARALVTSDDEFGVVASRVNAMLRQLEDALSELRASRSRIVAASDAERKRIERNIHDGAQQQLTALAIQLDLLREAAGDADLVSGLDDALARLRTSLDELQELGRGLHPAVLATDGLQAALIALGERSSVPVAVSAAEGRFGEVIEATAYYVAAEALANVAKYAQASAAAIALQRHNGSIVLEISDDGVGGADPGRGSGLAGLVDRVEALGGSLTVTSPPGHGTTVHAELPADATEASR